MYVYFCSAGDVVKMDTQPKSVSVAPGGLSLAVCIGQVCAPVTTVTYPQGKCYLLYVQQNNLPVHSVYLCVSEVVYCMYML